MSKEGASTIKIILTALGTAAMVAVAAGVFFFFTFVQSGEDITVTIEADKEKISRGVPTEFSVKIDNETNTALKETNLSLNLTEGLSFLQVKEADKIANRSIDTIGSGSLAKENFQILPTGQKGSKEKIEATLSYSFGSATFEKNVTKTVKIKEQAIKLNFEKPEEIITGSSFKTTVKYENTADFSFQDVNIEAQYPKGYEFLDASKPPSNGENRWSIGSLDANEKGQIKIRGRVQDQEVKPIKFKVLTRFLNKSYTVAASSSAVKPSRSPLQFNINFKGKPRLGEQVEFVYNFKNKSGTALKDVQISSVLRGELLDPGSVETEGNYREASKSITWNKDTNSELEVLEPEKSGQVKVSAQLKKDFSMSQLSDKNYTLQVEGRIKSDTVPYYLKAESTSASDKVEVKVGGEAEIDTKVMYRDPDSKIVNEGPMPPEVGKSTQFTVHWIVRNKLSDAENVKISATLPEGVKWTNRVKSNLESVPTYKSEENKVVWKIDKIQAGRGVINLPLEAVFQVELTPTETQVGTRPTIIKKTELVAEDAFTGEQRKAVSSPVNTSLPQDETIAPEDGKVVESSE